MIRTARLRALAKVNLDLRVLERRRDGFHELRTIFHTISLADRLEVAFEPRRRTRIALEGSDIPDNLVTRAARAAMDGMRITGEVRFRLEKRIPMGAGLGGGSSDAAAVMLALPVLADKHWELPSMMRAAAELGSDVPFFLFGGAAAAIGRGTELFPLPDGPSLPGVLLAPGIHVSTPAAYRALSPRLTSNGQENKIVSFQTTLWAEVWQGGRNDFEEVVFEAHPELARLKQRLERAGAAHAMMSGSGSSLFGLFRTRAEASRALQSVGDERSYPITLVSRAQYRRLWRRQLAPYTETRVWPPRSRHASPTRPKP
jgi:4-diphosphocytidyl-2-C-methyl-D-erythritol kinase